MPEWLDVTDRVIEQAVALTRDHAQLLTDLAVRLEPHLPELVDAWAIAYRDAAVRDPLPPDPAVTAIQEHAVQVLLSGLRRGNLRQYYTELTAWASEIASSGLSYDRAIGLVHAYRKSGLPLLMRVYPVGAQLELVLGALDDLDTGTVMVLGAVYLATAQGQLLSTARLRVVGQLATGVTHAFNNLLTGILGNTQLLLDRGANPEMQQELSQIQRAAGVGAQMTRYIQEHATAAPEERVVETDINEVVRQSAELTRSIWRDQAEAHGIVVDVVKDFSDVPPVLARPGALREILVILILNAVEAMPRGGLISLRTDRRGDAVLISVVDTGEGIPEAARRRVFDRFFSTKDATHPGLGLAIAQQLIQEHGGRLTVESEPGRGSIFTATLPVAQTVPPPGQAADVAGAPVSAATPGLQILIVDDEPAVRDILAKFLQFRGYAVTVAASGSEAIATLKKTRFDIVLTDLGMPGKSGWDVAREVKRSSATTLVVMITGWVADLDPDKARESGVDRILHKPFDVNLIDTLVAEALALRDKLREQ